MQHVKKLANTPQSVVKSGLNKELHWSNRSSKVSMFIATKFLNRIPVESGQLTAYLRQDVGLTGRGRRAMPKNLVYWSVCKQFFLLVKRSSNEWTNALFCWASFPAGGSFSCLKKQREPWGRSCIGGSLGTLRSDNGRRQWKCRWKIDFTFFEFFSPLYQVSQLLDGWNWRERSASEIREG